MVAKGEFDIGTTEYTITLEELVNRLQSAGDKMGRHTPNRLLFFNAAAALRTLGERLEAADRKLAEVENRPAILGPGGARVN